jgi:hypothetical protein
MPTHQDCRPNTRRRSGVNPQTGPDEPTHVQGHEPPQAGEPGLSDVVGSLLATPLRI